MADDDGTSGMDQTEALRALRIDVLDAKVKMAEAVAEMRLLRRDQAEFREWVMSLLFETDHRADMVPGEAKIRTSAELLDKLGIGRSD